MAQKLSTLKRGIGELHFKEVIEKCIRFIIKSLCTLRDRDSSTCLMLSQVALPSEPRLSFSSLAFRWEEVDLKLSNIPFFV